MNVGNVILSRAFGSKQRRSQLHLLTGTQFSLTDHHHRGIHRDGKQHSLQLSSSPALQSP